MTARWADVRETHTAVAFFVGNRVYKLKKPVDLGFLDFTSREARLAACNEEVRLNRRLAPDVYLGVADVVEDGEVVDHLVVMRRMPDDRRLSTLVAAGSPEVPDALREVARALAALHERSTVDDGVDSPGRHAAVRELWEQGLSEAEALADGMVPRRTLAAVRALALDYVAGRAALFDERVAQGCVREGHGDLLADDIFVLGDGPRILDCLEFDERLRVVDAWFDVAFLAMDLERLGRPDLADVFLDGYREFAATSAPASLLHLFVAHRAHVRSKVDLIRARQGSRSALREARRLLDMCLRHLRAGAVTVTVVGGLPGSGKTTVAAALADRLDAALLSSDVLRRSLAPTTGTAGEPGATVTSWESGPYSPDVTARTYDELLRRARFALTHGQSVVADASWRCAAHRSLVRELARDAHASLVEVQCVVPDDVAEGWLAGRRGGASDATASTRRLMRTRFDPWPEAMRVDPRDDAAERIAVAVAGVAERT